MASINNVACSDDNGIDASIVFGNVYPPPPKQSNLAKYGNKHPHLLIHQIEQLMAVIAKHSRLPDRDRLLIWTAFIHGMRVGEVIRLRWANVQRGITTPKIIINRLKNSDSGYHTMDHRELQYWARWENYVNRHPKYLSEFVFITERGSVISDRTVRAMMQKYCRAAQLPFLASPHILKHSCGVHLALQRIETRRIQMWLGHKNIQNTVIYTQIAGTEIDDIADTAFRLGTY